MRGSGSSPETPGYLTQHNLLRSVHAAASLNYHVIIILSTFSFQSYPMYSSRGVSNRLSLPLASDALTLGPEDLCDQTRLPRKRVSLWFFPQWGCGLL